VEFGDATFDTFGAFEQVVAVGNPGGPCLKLRAMHRRGAVLKRDLRWDFGLELIQYWAEHPAWMVVGSHPSGCRDGYGSRICEEKSRAPHEAR